MAVFLNRSAGAAIKNTNLFKVATADDSKAFLLKTKNPIAIIKTRGLIACIAVSISFYLKLIED
jgi:hypothetical protein